MKALLLPGNLYVPKAVYKVLYLIRHAEGESNVSDERLDPSAPLTQQGKEQTRLLAERFVALRPHALFSSPVSRSFDTAVEIGKACRLEPMPLTLLSPRRRPSELNKVAKSSEEGNAIDRILRENFHRPGWRYSDEENFEDLKARCLQILVHLSAQDGDRILAVTHGILIRIIVACAMMGEGITGEVCESFIRGCRTAKSGITTITVGYNTADEGIASKYQLWSWNDYSHLGEIAREDCE